MTTYQEYDAGRVSLRQVAETEEVDKLFLEIRLLIVEHERLLEKHTGHVIDDELHALLCLQTDRVQRAVDALRCRTEPRRS